MDYTSFLYDDNEYIAEEGLKEKLSGGWEKIKAAFQAMIDWCREKIQTLKENGLKAMVKSVLGDVKGLFEKAKRDRENAHAYLKTARGRVNACQDELAAAKSSKDKERIRAAKNNLKTAKSDYRQATRVAKNQDRLRKRYTRAVAKGKSERAGKLMGRYDKAEQKGNKIVYGEAAEFYMDDFYDDADLALESALAEYDASFVDESVAGALENMQLNIDINCTTAEECANITDSLDSQIEDYNRHLSTLRLATENYMYDQDKEAFQATTKNAMAALESSYNALGLTPTSGSGRFDEACIEQLHDFFEGAAQIMADKADEFVYDDYNASNESFLGSLVQ